MRKDFIFTSELLIYSEDDKIEEKLYKERLRVKEFIDENFNSFNKNSKLNSENFKIYLSLFESLKVSNHHLLFEIIKNYSDKIGKPDMTCCLKGLFISELISSLDLNDEHTNFVISFGKDICGLRQRIKISIEDSDIHFYTPYNLWGCFTSGNFGVRGPHILSSSNNEFRNLTVFGECKENDLAFMDAYSTYLYSTNREEDFLNKGYKILITRLK